MAQARGHINKTSLTPEEKLKCAYFHLVRGIAQHDLAALHGVNPGRVAEAVSDVMVSLRWDM